MANLPNWERRARVPLPCMRAGYEAGVWSLLLSGSTSPSGFCRAARHFVYTEPRKTRSLRPALDETHALGHRFRQTEHDQVRQLQLPSGDLRRITGAKNLAAQSWDKEIYDSSLRRELRCRQKVRYLVCQPVRSSSKFSFNVASCDYHKWVPDGNSFQSIELYDRCSFTMECLRDLSGAQTKCLSVTVFHQFSRML